MTDVSSLRVIIGDRVAVDDDFSPSLESIFTEGVRAKNGTVSMRDRMQECLLSALSRRFSVREATRENDNS